MLGKVLAVVAGEVVGTLEEVLPTGEIVPVVWESLPPGGGKLH
jgi:hypothetical protein